MLYSYHKFCKAICIVSYSTPLAEGTGVSMPTPADSTSVYSLRRRSQITDCYNGITIKTDLMAKAELTSFWNYKFLLYATLSASWWQDRHGVI